ncbi:phage holin, LLH family [Tetragenococcus halophilus]|uniref:phage holin, LLH family n=1 Tax=Tetragenococcus halophilus TaxID=51669 RepID=UPI00301020C7
MDAIVEALVGLLTTLIGVVAAWLAQKGHSFLKQKGLLTQLESKQQYAQIVVNAMKELYEEGEGDKKYQEAKDDLIDYFHDNKIPFSENELDKLIHSAVTGLKKGVLLDEGDNVLETIDVEDKEEAEE